MKPLRDVNVTDEMTVADLAREQRARDYTEAFIGAVLEQINQQARTIRKREAEIGVLEQAVEDAEREIRVLTAQVAALRER